MLIQRRELNSINPKYYESFLNDANRFVDSFIIAWNQDNFGMLSQAINNYRLLMLELGNRADINIETNELTALIESAQNLDFLRRYPVTVVVIVDSH